MLSEIYMRFEITASELIASPQFKTLTRYRKGKIKALDGSTVVARLWVEESCIKATCWFERTETKGIIRDFFPTSISGPTLNLYRNKLFMSSRTSIKSNLKMTSCHPDFRAKYNAVETTYHVYLEPDALSEDGLTLRRRINIGIFPENQVQKLDGDRYSWKKVETLAEMMKEATPDVVGANHILGTKGWTLEDFHNDAKVAAHLDKLEQRLQSDLDALANLA